MIMHNAYIRIEMDGEEENIGKFINMLEATTTIFRPTKNIFGDLLGFEIINTSEDKEI